MQSIYNPSSRPSSLPWLLSSHPETEFNVAVSHQAGQVEISQAERARVRLFRGLPGQASELGWWWSPGCPFSGSPGFQCRDGERKQCFQTPGSNNSNKKTTSQVCWMLFIAALGLAGLAVGFYFSVPLCHVTFSAGLGRLGGALVVANAFLGLGVIWIVGATIARLRSEEDICLRWCVLEAIFSPFALFFCWLREFR